MRLSSFALEVPVIAAKGRRVERLNPRTPGDRRQAARYSLEIDPLPGPVDRAVRVGVNPHVASVFVVTPLRAHDGLVRPS